MLCNIIVIDSFIPINGFIRVVINVAIPSGILCSIKPIKFNIPTLLYIFSSFIYLSIIVIVNDPIINSIIAKSDFIKKIIYMRNENEKRRNLY